MGARRVFATGGGLAFAEAHMVRNDNPMCPRQRRDEAAPDIAPGRLPVQQQDRTSGALVDILVPKPGGIGEIWRERPGSVENLVCRYHRGCSRLPASVPSPDC